MAGSVFGFGPRGILPEQQTQDPAQRRLAIDKLATDTQIPANVLLALEEAGEPAEAASSRLGAEIKAGKRVEEVVPADTMSRAYDIADALYPAQKTEEKPKDEPGVIGDTMRQMGGALVSGIGSMGEAFGAAADIYADGGVKLDPQSSMAGDAFRAAGGAVRDVGDSIKAGVSEAGKQAMEGSMPDGDLTDPSTWTMGENPSLRGYTMLAADVLGSFLPVVATAVITKNPGASAIVGGAQGGGAAVETARDTVLEMSRTPHPDGGTVLSHESAYYRGLIDAGIPPDEAVRRTSQAAEKMAMLFTTPVSVFGGAATGKLLGPGVDALAGKGLATRAIGTGVASSMEEGLQESAETYATRTGINAGAETDLNPSEGTFGDFILGALGGGVPGAAAGALQEKTGGDGSAPGSAAVPGDGLSPPVGAGPGAAAPDQPLAPTGPISSVAGLAPDLTPVPEPDPPAPKFPDFKPGKGVRLADPETGVIHDAVFLSETPDGVMVRIAGGEFEIDRQEFDASRMAATTADEEAAGKKPKAKKAKVESPASPPVELVAASETGMLDTAAADALKEQGYYDGPWNDQNMPKPGMLDAPKLSEAAKPAPPAKQPKESLDDLSPEEAQKRAKMLEDRAAEGGWTRPMREKHQRLKAIAGAQDGATIETDKPVAGKRGAVPARPAGDQSGGSGRDAGLAGAGDGAVAAPSDQRLPVDQVRADGAPDNDGALTARAPVAPITMPPDKRIQPDMLGGADTTEAAMAAKEKNRKEWGRFLAIAEAGKSQDDSMLAGREVLIRGATVRIRAEPGKASDQDIRGDTAGMDRDQIAAAVRGAMNELDRRAPLPTSSRAEASDAGAPAAPVRGSEAAGESRRDNLVKEMEKGGKNAEGESILQIANPKLYDLLEITTSAIGRDAADYIAAIKAAMEMGRADIADEIVARMERHAQRAAAQKPGVDEDHPRYQSIKANLAEKADEAARDVEAARKALTGAKSTAATKPEKQAATGILSVLSADKQARAADLQKRLADKMRNQVSSGLDPEYITIGGELVALYIEAGAKRFGQMLHDFAAATGLTLKQAQEPLRAAYNHVRDNLELEGEDVSGMDDARAVLEEARQAIQSTPDAVEAKATQPLAKEEGSPSRRDLNVDAPPVPSSAPWWDSADDLTRRLIMDAADLSPRATIAPSFAEMSEPLRARLTDAFGRLYRDHKIENIGTIEAPRYALTGETIEGTATPVPTAAEVKAAAATADPAPTDAQKEAGNYRMGHIAWHGLDITIETAKGEFRRGKDADGEAWQVKMPAHYGYIRRSEGADGDHLDIYMGDHPDSDFVLVVDQVDADTRAWDEHKVMLGFRNQKHALDTYNAGFSDGRGNDRRGGVKVMTVDEFKTWLESGDLSRPVRMEPAAAPSHRQHEGKPKPQKRPFITYVATRMGGIDPEGRAARELRHRGVTARTAPGLFRRDGHKDMDNIPVDEHPDLIGAIPADESTWYFDPDRIIGAIVAEVAGTPLPFGRHEAEQWMALGSSRMSKIDRIISGAMDDLGISTALTEEERSAIIAELDRGGGNAWDAIYDVIVRSERDAVQETSGDESTAREGDEVPFGDDTDGERSEVEPGGQDGSSEEGDDPSGHGERDGDGGDSAAGQQGLGTPSTEPGADGLPQTVIPGTEGSKEQATKLLSDRQKSEIEARRMQSKMRRLDGNTGDAGPLFDSQSDLFAARPQGAEAEVQSRPTQPDDAQTPQKTGKIEDFGEKIEGAKKDVWATYGDRIKDAEKVDIKAEPLSVSWPAPDYEAMIADGVDPWTVAFVRAAREAIPTKPQKSWRLKGWVENVQTLRGLATSLITGEADAVAIRQKLASTGLSKIKDSIDLYLAVGHSKSLKGVSMGAGTYSVRNGIRLDPPETVWEIEQAAKATAFSNMPRVLASGKTREAVIEAFKARFNEIEISPAAAKQPKFIIYSRDKRSSWVIGVKIGKNHVDLRSVPTVQEARRVIAEEADALRDQLVKMRDIPRERRDENNPRVGIDHRSGADVSPEQFAEAFGFRGVQFGNWVEGDRRQQDLNQTYDALLDLAGVLDLPPKALSLNGSLGLAFGARGSGGKNAAAAHFEPDLVVINLTKKEGAGSLAHEWFHAADNYFSRRRADGKGGAGYITDSALPKDKVEGLRPELLDAFSAVRRAIAETGMKARSSNLDKTRSSPYWATGIEMHARAFESYVIAKLQDQSAANDYLANIVDGLAWAMKAEMSGLGDSYPYLTEAEVEAVRPAFDRLFRTIETRDTDRGVSMEMRQLGDGGAEAFVADFMAELATVDELFQNPRAKTKDIREVFTEIDSSIQFITDAATAEEGTSFRERADEMDVDHMFRFRTKNRRGFWVYQKGDEVWTDVSSLSPGSGGTAIYSALFDYAHNNDMTFKGDPEGLSDDALIRRTDNMLASALKWGTTRHMRPHPRQIEGDKALNVAPLQWTEGNDSANIRALIKASLSNLIAKVPEVADARYDFNSHTFRSGAGQWLSDGALDEWTLAAGRSGEARPGRATLKRGILLNTLARIESGARPGLLEQALRQPGKLVSPGLVDTFYFEGDKPGTSDPLITDTDFGAITRDLNAEMARSGLEGKVGVRVVKTLYSRATGLPLYGRFDVTGWKSAEVSVTARNRDAEGIAPIDVMRHEIIHALRSSRLWNKDFGLFTEAEWRSLEDAARAEPDIARSVKERYPGLTRPEQTEEMVAELYRLWSADRDSFSGIEKVLLKVEGFLTALANLFRGRGFVSAARTLEKIATGGIGGRGPQGPDDKQKPTSADRIRSALAMEMRGPKVKTETAAFRRWFGDSKVVGADGEPMVVYRGEHGVPGEEDFQSRVGSLTFASAEVASIYATDANDRRDRGNEAAPRVTPVYLRIEKPLYENRDDPFVDVSELIEKLGREAVVEALKRHRGDVVNTGLWDQNTSRPRFMQNDMGKALTIFRQYSVNLAYRIFRDVHQSLRGATKEDRAEARTQLVGVTLSMMAHAGIKGTYGYGIIMLLLSMFFPGDSDDIEEWLQDALLMEGDGLGTAAWNYAMGAALNGVPGQILGADLSERIGSPNIWFRGPSSDLEGEDVVMHYVTELLGPPLGIALGIGRGMQLVTDGEIYRGIEASVPKVVRDILKAGRYGMEGVETLGGDDILPDVNPYQLLLQASGFTPAEVAERFDMNSRLKSKEREILDERKGIHKAAVDALLEGQELPASVLEDIRDFNSRFPEYPITAKTIRASAQGRQRAHENAEAGVSLNKRLSARLREGLAEPVYN